MTENATEKINQELTNLALSDEYFNGVYDNVFHNYVLKDELKPNGQQKVEFSTTPGRGYIRTVILVMKDGVPVEYNLVNSDLPVEYTTHFGICATLTQRIYTALETAYPGIKQNHKLLDFDGWFSEYGKKVDQED